jgi:hypothetical protein
MDMGGLAERVRAACVEAALKAYEEAGVQGLCAEGRWEVAVSAMRTLDLAPLQAAAAEGAADDARLTTPRR